VICQQQKRVRVFYDYTMMTAIVPFPLQGTSLVNRKPQKFGFTNKLKAPPKIAWPSNVNFALEVGIPVPYQLEYSSAAVSQSTSLRKRAQESNYYSLEDKL